MARIYTCLLLNDSNIFLMIHGFKNYFVNFIPSNYKIVIINNYKWEDTSFSITGIR